MGESLRFLSSRLVTRYCHKNTGDNAEKQLFNWGDFWGTWAQEVRLTVGLGRVRGGHRQHGLYIKMWEKTETTQPALGLYTYTQQSLAAPLVNCGRECVCTCAGRALGEGAELSVHLGGVDRPI